MIGKWEVPSIEHIGTVEARRLARVPVPGLKGDLHQDLGGESLVVEISGTLASDQARDDFLQQLRTQFKAGQPVTFVADILTATDLDKVIIEALEVEECNDAASSFSYRIVLREYVEPPAPEPAIDDLGSDLKGDLGDAAKLGLDGLELPNILGDIPSIGDPEPPLRAALDGVKSALGGLTAPLSNLTSALKGAAPPAGSPPPGSPPPGSPPAGSPPPGSPPAASPPPPGKPPPGSPPPIVPPPPVASVSLEPRNGSPGPGARSPGRFKMWLLIVRATMLGGSQSAGSPRPGSIGPEAGPPEPMWPIGGGA